MSEFPNDNPELWRPRAAVFAGLELEPEPVSAPVPEALTATTTEPEPSWATEPEPAATVDDDPEVEVIEFDDADFASLENESIPPPAPPPDLFQVYVQTLVEVALAAGAPSRVVELLPGMLGLSRLDVRALDAAAVDSLVAAGMLARSESGAIVRSAAFTASAQAWRATLLGEEADFSACNTMLDEWSAGVVATLAGTPAQKEILRRDLRARGVAAFGLLVDAA